MNITLQKAFEVLASARRVVIAGHSDPDGDALGSILGLGHILADNGCQIWLYRDGLLPVDYRFLPGADKVLDELPTADWPDLLVLLDCHQAHRAGQRLADWLPVGLKVLVLDHHLGEAPAEYLVVKDPMYSATAELIALLFKQAGWSVGLEAAKCLYAAFMADTGNFTQGNTTGQVLELAGWLVSNGANPEELSLLSHSITVNRLRLHAMALMRVSSFANERVFFTYVTKKDLQDYNCTLADLEGLVEPLRFIEGGLIAAILKEIAPGQIKVSIRSKRHVDVNKLAMQFGGGGHKNAAGFKSEGSLEEVQTAFIKKAEALLEEYDKAQAS